MRTTSTHHLMVVISCLCSMAAGVGPRLKNSDLNIPGDNPYQNKLILEELRTITDLVLRGQRREKDCEPSMHVIQDCTTLREAGIKASGVYSIFPFPFKVYCNMETDGGGWTVIQRRTPNDIQENFNRSWDDYRLGFGDWYNEFWLGLEYLHQLTYSGSYELRIDMVDFEHGRKYAHYKTISVGSEADGYRLKVFNYSGNAGDALTTFHNGRRFSTYDKDQDVSRNKSCAQEKLGGWWFHACYAAHPNGVYPVKPKRKGSSSEIRWWSNRENVLVLTAFEMKIRRSRNNIQDDFSQDTVSEEDGLVSTTETPSSSSPVDDILTTTVSPPLEEGESPESNGTGAFDYDYHWEDGGDEFFYLDEYNDEVGYNITEYS